MPQPQALQTRTVSAEKTVAADMPSLTGIMPSMVVHQPIISVMSTSCMRLWQASVGSWHERALGRALSWQMRPASSRSNSRAADGAAASHSVAAARIDLAWQPELKQQAANCEADQQG